jgi:NAD(P)-dependent dehydrogenase (short-subunit alcohol dehydrogenase family)
MLSGNPASLRRRAASRRRSLQGQVVVITGASAGVGRATAQTLSLLGADLALLARDGGSLDATRLEIEAMGGRARTYPVDVADSAAVLRVTRQVEAELGRIDVWINNAMVTVFGGFQQVTPEEFRRVTEVTYLGAVHGTRAALGAMQARNRGVIVQVGSGLAYRGIPLQTAYCGAKHAVRGFTDALRTELLQQRSGIRLTAVHLPAINTPQFDWARTHRKQAPRPVAPVYSPLAAARAIAHAVRHPAREYWLGGMTPLMILGDAVAPGTVDRILARTAVQGQDSGAPVRADRRDNLSAPVGALARMEGSFGDEVTRAPLRVRDGATRLLAFVMLLTLGVAAGALLHRGRAA